MTGSAGIEPQIPWFRVWRLIKCGWDQSAIKLINRMILCFCLYTFFSPVQKYLPSELFTIQHLIIKGKKITFQFCVHPVLNSESIMEAGRHENAYWVYVLICVIQSLESRECSNFHAFPYYKLSMQIYGSHLWHNGCIAKCFELHVDGLLAVYQHAVLNICISEFSISFSVRYTAICLVHWQKRNVGISLKNLIISWRKVFRLE